MVPPGVVAANPARHGRAWLGEVAINQLAKHNRPGGIWPSPAGALPGGSGEPPYGTIFLAGVRSPGHGGAASGLLAFVGDEEQLGALPGLELRGVALAAEVVTDAQPVPVPPA